MSHEIFGERFLGRREPAWHGLGQVFDAPIGAVEAVEAGSMDFEIVKAPVTAHFSHGGSKRQVKVRGQYALLREPTHDEPHWEAFGTVSAKYELLQNTELASIIEPLTELWPVETVGSLHMGRDLFMVLDAGDAAIKGDQIRGYFMVVDRRTGRHSLKIAFTPVRVVCQNTLTTGLKEATISAALAHNSKVEAGLRLRVDMLEHMQRAQALSILTFESLAETLLRPAKVKKVIHTAYPYPAKPARVTALQQAASMDLSVDVNEDMAADVASERYTFYVQRADNFREAAVGRLGNFNEENPDLANTAWAVYNAVVEVEDYRRYGSEKQSLVSALFGERARIKRRAYSAAMAEVS